MIVVEPEAQSDIDAAVAWYDENEFEMGSAFLRQLKATLAIVAEKPGRRPRHRPGLHRAKMRHFHRRDASVLDARLN